MLGRRKLDRFYTEVEIKEADISGKLISRNLKNPVKKDTLVIPSGGVAVIRFLADNAGWLTQLPNTKCQINLLILIMYS